jgi:hypothetical protein
MENRFAIIPIIVMWIVIGTQWGRRRRAAGSPVTPHESMRFGFLVFAVTLPPFILTEPLSSPIIPLFDKVIITSITLGTAVAPLAVDWLIRSALRIVRRWEGRA